VYLASESDAPAFFDNLSVSHQQAMIVQEHHFDPAGLHLVGIEKEGSYPYQYNGLSEQQADPTGKGYSYETDWRGYDPQLGRFKGIDALANEMPGINPYQYSYNNPVMFNDPSGEMPWGIAVGAFVGGASAGYAAWQGGANMGQTFLGALAGAAALN
jgi:RHS repeat-associated protein